MKLYSLFFYIFIIFSFNALSATGNKNLCNQSSGMWRIFNHTCFDDCAKEVDKNTPCYKILEYGCDCGENKCWQNDKCIDTKNIQQKKYKTYKVQQKQITKNKNNNVPEVNEDNNKNNLFNFFNNISDKVKGKDTVQCEKSGGKIIDFRNSCADNCNLDRNSVCAQVITRSCDCGPGKCWDKTKCK